MKKIVSFALWLLLAVSACASANQDQDEPTIPSTKIPYQRDVPLSVRSKMPRGGLTRFFGYVNVERTTLALHLYERTQKNESAPKGILLQKCVLNVFIERKVGNRRKFSLINSVSLNSIHYDSADFYHIDGFSTIGMNLLWLDPKQRKTPVIMMDAYLPSGYYQGTNLLVVFLKGLSHKPVVQGFGYGTSNASDGGVWRSFFNHTDERGFLMVKTTHVVNPDAGDGVVWLRWNGKGFASTNR